jgi:hypothetical protein
MLIALALVALIAGATLVEAVLAWLVDAVERRRLRRVHAEVRVTDAVHAAMGAIVAPTVAGRSGKRWTVTMGLTPADFPCAGRLADIARQALGQDGTGVRVVFTPRRAERGARGVPVPRVTW